jgi:hypothetical protein
MKAVLLAFVLFPLAVVGPTPICSWTADAEQAAKIVEFPSIKSSATKLPRSQRLANILVTIC